MKRKPIFITCGLVLVVFGIMGMGINLTKLNPPKMRKMGSVYIAINLKNQNPPITKFLFIIEY
ncbi:hypothetical protein D0U04_26475 [Bacillus clarus]|uniref:Uncharacterized protein n=1 Tax=Bacillus clarus TaxID=2338372 RepID=A0ABX9KP06_9BACI|nr:hypothetical protein D0U04_26475 [Bacillus clarus]